MMNNERSKHSSNQTSSSSSRSNSSSSSGKTNANSQISLSDGMMTTMMRRKINHNSEHNNEALEDGREEGDTYNNSNSNLRHPLLPFSSPSSTFYNQNSHTYEQQYETDDDDDDDDDDDVKNDDDIAFKLNKFLHQNHLYILLPVIILLLPLGIYSFSKFISSTDSTIHPILNSPSYFAVNRFRDAFGGGAGGRSAPSGTSNNGLRNDDPLNPGMIVLLEHHNLTAAINNETQHSGDNFIDGSSDLYLMTKNYTSNLQQYLSHNLPLPSSCTASRLPSYSRKKSSSSLSTIITPMIDITSYYSLQEDKLYTASNSLTAKDGNVIILYISYSIPSCLYAPMSSGSGGGGPSTKNGFQKLMTKNNVRYYHNTQRKYALSILSMIESYTNENLLITSSTAPSSQQSNRNNMNYDITMGYTGMIPFQNDMSLGVKEDIHRLHVFILPLSLILLCLALKGHYSIVLIPVFSVLCVCCAWSIVMLLLIQFGFLQVTQFTPTVMMSLSIGLGIDYTLFLLSRVFTEVQSLRKAALIKKKTRRKLKLNYEDPFHNYLNHYHYNNTWSHNSKGAFGTVIEEEIDDDQICRGHQRNENNMIDETNADEEEEERDIHYKAIRIMIKHAGQTILMSGITLIFTFLGLLLFPIHALQSVSIGASVCIIFCLIINLIIVPSVLHSNIGYYIMQRSRPTSGETGLDTTISIVKQIVLSLRKRYRFWKYQSRNLSSSRLRSNTTGSSSHDSQTRSIASKHNTTPNIDSGIGTDDTNRFPNDTEDDGYTCFQDLILQNEFSNENPLRATSSSNISGVHKFNASGGLDESSQISDEMRIFGEEWLNHYDDCSDDGNNNDVDPSSFWYKLATHLLHPTRSIFIFCGIMILLVPIAFQGKKIKTSISFELMLPWNSPSMQTYHRFGQLFGEGKVSPYRLLFDGLDFGDRIDTIDGFDVMHNVLQQLEQQSDEPENNVSAHCTGIAWANGAPISHTTYQAAKACAATFRNCPFESSRELMKLDSTSTSNDGLSTLATCYLSESSFTAKSVNWLDQSRRLLISLHESGELHNFTVSIEGGASIEYDAEQSVEQSLHLMFSVTLCCVFFITALFFRSIVTPLRSVISISMTLACVYGLVELVYQNQVKTISWMTVPMSFSIIVGLGLDYDIFLINRVLEYRVSGYDHHSSIIAGLYQTGSIITAAGLVMAVSFGGLIFSASPAICQWSFSLTMAVLIDTFLMKSCVVPILLAKTGKISWFPRTLPESIKSLDSVERDNNILL